MIKIDYDIKNMDGKTALVLAYQLPDTQDNCRNKLIQLINCRGSKEI